MTKTIKGIIWVKVVSAFLCCFTMFTYSHNIRQLDTMGVSLRYWLRWTIEPILKYPLLPASLNTGDHYGLALMEFPIVNLMTAPFFFFGPKWGLISARVFLFLLIILLTYFHHKIWKDKKVLGLEVKWSSWLMLVFGVTTLYVERFMPDMVAFYLASLAVGLSWNKGRPIASLTLASLGLLIKPPVVTVFIILFFKPFKKTLEHSLKWVLPAIGICLLYYIFGIEKLRELSDFTGSFAVSLRNPIDATIAFFSSPWIAFKVFIKHIFSAHTVYILAPWSIYFYYKKGIKRPLLFLIAIIIQYLVAVILVGDAAYAHNYYFIGTSFLAALLLKDCLDQRNKYLTIPLILLFGGHTVERAYYNLRPFWRGHILQECNSLQQYIPKAEWKINTVDKFFSHLGVCMGRVQGSKTSNFGVYYKYEAFDHNNYEIIQETKQLYLVKKRIKDD